MSVAVELAGVNDTDVDELVRITNLIASKVSSGSDEDDDQTLEMTVGTAAGQEI